MSKPKVVITRKWPEAAESKAAELFDVQLNKDDKPMTVAELQAALKTADAVCPTVSDKISAEVLNIESMQCRILGNYGVGFNHIDLEAAKARGLRVTNTPEILTECTADTAITLMLMIARRAGEGERHVREQQWEGWRPTHMLGTKVTGKTLGLIGMGRIARAMAHRAHHGFNMNIIYRDPYPPMIEDIADLGAEPRSSIEEVMEEADFVSLHCPGGDDTYHLIDAERIALMRPEAYLINSARGDVIDPKALIAALKSGAIAGAALDVYEGEPKVQSELLSMDNVVLFPHLGSATTETRVAMGLRALANVESFLADKTPQDVIV